MQSATDQVIEQVGEGNDTVRSSVGYTLGADVENLTLTGSAATGTGNAVSNLIIGNAAANTLSGGLGNDRLLGAAGNDHLLGGDGIDILAGGDGSDTLSGGAARDIFVFTTLTWHQRRREHDFISDFKKGDLIDISALYAGMVFGGIKGTAAQMATLSDHKPSTFLGGKTYLAGTHRRVAGADLPSSSPVQSSSQPAIAGRQDGAISEKLWTVARAALRIYHHDYFW